MQHIKTQREIFRQLLHKYEVDDIYDFFSLIWNDANSIREIENEFIDRQEEELTKYLNGRLSGVPITIDDLRNEYIFWVEKNRNRPLDMGEMNDIEEAIEIWAKDNGYGYLYED